MDLCLFCNLRASHDWHSTLAAPHVHALEPQFVRTKKKRHFYAQPCTIYVSWLMTVSKGSFTFGVLSFIDYLFVCLFIQGPTFPWQSYFVEPRRRDIFLLNLAPFMRVDLWLCLKVHSPLEFKASLISFVFACLFVCWCKVVN